MRVSPDPYFSPPTRKRKISGLARETTRRLTSRLETLAEEFKVYHYAIIDLLDAEEDLAKEQELLDSQEDFVTDLTVRLEKFITTCSSSDSSQIKIIKKRLKHVEKGVGSVFDVISSFAVDDDDSICVLQQHEECLTEFKKELSDVRYSFITLELDSSDLDRLLAKIEKDVFNCSLKIRKLLHSQVSGSTATDSKGVKLPKLDVPTFDGNILNWITFWEQFNVTVHTRSNLENSEKLAYLRNALKDGTAKNIIEGLSRSGEQYDEAITCLKSRYNRPRLIHQAHVRKIIETSNLKDGSGKELRRLHDTAQQHLRALKAMGHEPPGSFITSVLELKLDVDTMFEWQRHSQEHVDVPPYQDLLDFINLRAQASEAAVQDTNKKSLRADPPVSAKKNVKPVASFAAGANATSGNCVICKSEKHPLYACAKFKSLSHGEKLSTLKSNGLCLNCLRSGHFVKGCKSLHKCRVCQKPHHTLLHVEEKSNPPTPTESAPVATPPTPVSSHVAMKIQANVLLMTCQVQVQSPSGLIVKARALLDSASSASFISERLAQGLGLPRSHQNARISGFAGLTRSSLHQSIADFSMVTTHPPGERISVSAIVVPRVTCDLPLQPISFDLKWSHLLDIELADPDFGVPRKVDILLGVDVFANVVLQGRRYGSPGSPIAFETKFGWSLAGRSDTGTEVQSVVTHHVSLLTGDDLIRKFWELEECPSISILTPEEKAVVKHFESQHCRAADGRFVVPLPKQSGSKPLGESRSQAVRRFVAFEHSLHAKGLFSEFKDVIDEYFHMGHAELVPEVDLEKSQQSVFYLPMHAVRKESSTTTKVRAVFDASARTSTLLKWGRYGYTLKA